MIPYQLKSFRGGVSDEKQRGIVGSFAHGHALDIHKKDDTLSCNQAMATVLDATVGMGEYGGTLMTGLINVFLPASDGSTYAFSDRGSVFCRTGEGNWTFVYNDEAGKITGAAEWKDDAGSNYIYWATSTQISRKPFPGANSAPDTATMRWTDVTNEWKTENVLTRPDNSNWHTMRQANGAMYIANRESLSEISFTSSDWDPLTLNIRPGNTIKCLEERDDLIIVGSTREDQSEEGHLWSWISTATNWLTKKKLPIKGINALIDTEYPLAQGGADGELFYSDLRTVVPINRVTGGGQVNPGGVDILDDRAMFGMYGSSITYPGIWSFGRKNKNRNPSFNYEYRLVGTVGGSTVGTIGAIRVAEGNLLASWGSSEINNDNSYGIDQVSSTTKATAIYEGLEFDAGSAHLEKKFDTVKVTMAPLPVSTSISIKFKLDKDVSWKYAVLGDRTTTYSQTDATAAIFSINRPAEVFEIGAELNPSGNTTPDILSITTYLSNQNNEF